MWEKLGLIIDTGFIETFSISHAAIPFVYPVKDQTYKIFFASRDERSRSHIFSANLNFASPFPKLDPGSLRKVMGLGNLGAFDDNGVMPSWIVQEENLLYLYYSGWSLGQTVPFYFYIGLAVSDDGGENFKRVSAAPIMGRSSMDPYLTASPCVIKQGDSWLMWYISGRGWQHEENGLKHYYYIRHARSFDGVHWEALAKPCIDFASQDEYAMARPCVVAVEGGYLMWYAYRGASYRLGFAASRDGINWKRLDDKVGIDVSSAGWDSEMIEYAHVFQDKDTWWMLYNGNGYGKTGIGLAKANGMPSLDVLL